MINEHIQIEVEINEKIETSIHVSDVLYAINRLPLLKRWNCIGNILMHLKLTGLDEDGDGIDDEEKLTPSQKELIKNFLKKQLELIIANE